MWLEGGGRLRAWWCTGQRFGQCCGGAGPTRFHTLFPRVLHAFCRIPQPWCARCRVDAALGRIFSRRTSWGVLSLMLWKMVLSLIAAQIRGLVAERQRLVAVEGDCLIAVERMAEIAVEMLGTAVERFGTAVERFGIAVEKGGKGEIEERENAFDPERDGQRAARQSWWRPCRAASLSRHQSLKGKLQ